MFAYVGTFTRKSNGGVFGGDGEGVYAFDVSGANGSLRWIETHPLADPTFLAVSYSRRVLYAASHSVIFEGQPGAGITSFRIADDGRLKRINTQRLRHPHVTMISLDPTESYILAASSLGGAASALRLDDDGALGDVTDVVQFGNDVVIQVGETPEPTPVAAEPEASPGMAVRTTTRFPVYGTKTIPHSIRASTSGHHVFIADVSLDCIFAVGFDQVEGRFGMHAQTRVARNVGPRILAVHPNLENLYCVNEVDSTVSVYRLSAQTETPYEVQHLSTLWPGTRIKNTGCGIAIHPTGRFLYASNRGDDSIAIFEVDEAGELTLQDVVPSRGRFPVHLGITPDGAFLSASNNLSDTVATFRIDGRNGALMATGLAPVPSPTCVTFI